MTPDRSRIASNEVGAQEVYVYPFPWGRENFASVPSLRGLRGHSEFTALMSDLHREHEGYRKEFGFARDNASL